MATGGGNDFSRNPGGSGSAGGAKPRDLTRALGEASQRASDGADIDTSSIPEGGLLPPADPRGDDRGNPIGTTAQGGRPPYRLNG